MANTNSNLYSELSYENIADIMKSALGRTVQVLSANGSRTAKVLGLDEDFRLSVEYENGEKEALISGELSVKI